MSRLRPLSSAQASNCENAREPVCKCRCGGALHGAARAPIGSAQDDPLFYESLPETDPHHLPSDAERKELKRLRGMVAQLVRYAAMWVTAHPEHPERVGAEARLAAARADLARVERVVLGLEQGVAPEAPATGLVFTDYDVWRCPDHGEWTVPSRPHRPECPTCGKGGWWQRFTTGRPYDFAVPAS